MNYAAALLIMAVITYLIRMIPLAFFKKEIKNEKVQAFLYYIPYAVLSAMTFPAILYSTNSVPAASVGMAAAMVTAYFNKGLMPTAACAILAACIINLAL